MIVDQTQTIYSNINKKKKKESNSYSIFDTKKETISPFYTLFLAPILYQRNISTLSKNPTQRIHFPPPFSLSKPPNIQRSFRAFPSPSPSPFKPINSRFWWSRRQRQSFAFQEPPLRSLHTVTVPGWTRSKKVSPSRGTGSVSKLSLNCVQGLETIEQCRGHGRVSPRREWNQ